MLTSCFVPCKLTKLTLVQEFFDFERVCNRIKFEQQPVNFLIGERERERERERRSVN